MTSCAQCKQRFVPKDARVNCNGCKRYIHDRCLVRFLGSTKKQAYCNRNFAQLVNSAAGGGSVLSRISDQNSSRTALFDSARNFDPNNSFLSSGSANHDLTMQHNVNNHLGGISSNFTLPMRFSMAGMHNMSEVQANNSFLNQSSNFQSVGPSLAPNAIPNQFNANAQLPGNWGQMSKVERSDILLQLLAQNQTIIQSLVNDHHQIRSELADHSVRLSNLESNQDCIAKNNSGEFNQLKEFRRRGAGTAEIKIVGIPVENTVAFSDLAVKLLGVLKLQDLCTDILEVRELKAKNSIDSENTSKAKNNMDTEDASEANNNVDIDDASVSNVNAPNKNRSSAFVIKFKSQFISSHVLKVKRKHGMLKFKDLVSGGSDNVISVFELLPPYSNELRILAKDRASERGYKHVWPVDGCIFVKKTDSSVPIVIST